MPPFGFFPGKQLTSQKPPRGYGAALARVGTLEESVFCSLKIWTLEDYVAHWRLAAASALQSPAPHLFCTDLTAVNATMFKAFRSGRMLLFQQQLVPRKRLTLEQRRLATDRVAFAPGASTWCVDPEDLRAFLAEET